ncbi:proline-rich proteoglycan 2-like [Helianthus annuus]|uniref:proline-rich proteoglycan 2-like n=1 Tax=Helianthus annuus TaxID=4232 RepID=UPI000B9013A4|nr:proline-rich proteoglycan 2-like [Helianthus annuus]
MPPRFRRGRGKAPFTSHDHEAGPSHRRTPSITTSTSPQEPWRTYVEPARRTVSLSSSPSYHHSFGPQSENEPHNPQSSFIPLQWSNSHHSFNDPTPFFQSRFNPANYIEEPVGFNPLGPEDHFSGDHAMDMDEDTDPAEPPTRTPTHPIEISNGSSFHGSLYRGPDSYQARFTQYDWVFTPSYLFSPHQQQQQQDPSEDSRFVAVTPPPPPPVQQPPPEPPRRRRSNARMSVRGGMGGPSNPVSEVETAPVAPPLGFGNPIPAYVGSAAYNLFEQPAHTNYNYAEADPYLVAANYNALHPEGPYGAPWGVGYPAYGYQQPPPPQPPHQQPPQQQLIPPERQQEVLDRLSQVEREVQAERRNNQGFFKGLASLIKGKTKRRDF